MGMDHTEAWLEDTEPFIGEEKTIRAMESL